MSYKSVLFFQKICPSLCKTVLQCSNGLLTLYFCVSNFPQARSQYFRGSHDRLFLLYQFQSKMSCIDLCQLSDGLIGRTLWLCHSQYSCFYAVDGTAEQFAFQYGLEGTTFKNENGEVSWHLTQISDRMSRLFFAVSYLFHSVVSNSTFALFFYSKPLFSVQCSKSHLSIIKVEQLDPILPEQNSMFVCMSIITEE